VFSFYVKMPETRWDEIAEVETSGDNERFSALRDEFNRDFRRSDLDPKDVSSFDLVVDKDSWAKAGDYSDLHG
jgi:hypothetical protein